MILTNIKRKGCSLVPSATFLEKAWVKKAEEYLLYGFALVIVGCIGWFALAG